MEDKSQEINKKESTLYFSYKVLVNKRNQLFSIYRLNSKYLLIEYHLYKASRPIYR